MNVYLFSMIVGVVGLLAMAFSGLGRHGHGGPGHAVGRGSGSAGHGSHPGAHLHGSTTQPAAHGSMMGNAGWHAAGWLLMTPRLLFAGLLGFGIIGLTLRSLLGGGVLLLVALAGGIAFERLVMAPMWNFALRFASRPATMFESAYMAEATAVSSFDRNGQGIIAVEIDGQIQQVLATLQSADRAAGAIVRAGQKVRIEEVDGARHRCTVTVL